MTSSSLPNIYVLYENPDWIPPLQEGLEKEGFSVCLIHVNDGRIDPSKTPYKGIWINRISASSHTRDHIHTVEMSRQLLFWLESQGRRVINGLHTFELEMSKFRQDLILRRHGIKTPQTVLAIGKDNLLKTAVSFDGPFITKHDQGGKGLGIKLFQDFDEFENYISKKEFDSGPGNRMILQEYISAPEPFITRVEIVGGQFLFAMRSSTLQGFELCPSDICNPTSTNQNGTCPAGNGTFNPSPITAKDPLIQQYIQLCQKEGLEIAGIEFVEDANGSRYTYDINCTTNYNQVLGSQLGIDGMREVARYIRKTAMSN